MEGLADMSVFAERDLNRPAERKRTLYAAFASGDARFDGRVFVGVSSTGIYCRTVCTAKMPKLENCTFFHTAAEAEAAGYRPCMTCRPEVAPGMSNVDAQASLARRAATMLRDECARGDGVEAVAARLGYTGRHLRRAFVEEYGVTPSRYVQTCRLLLAKSLLTDSELTVASIAKASGFGSVRRFNQVFKEQYRMTPTGMRKRGRKRGSPSGTVTVRLGYRPPYRFAELLAFFRDRALPGIEVVDERSYARTVRLDAFGALPAGGSHAGEAPVVGFVRVANDPSRNQLVVTFPETLVTFAPLLVGRIRRMFDTDCDPYAIAEGIASLDEAAPGAVRRGVRLPGCFDAFETACRAVLGQQVTVKAANKLAERIARVYGTAVDTGIEGLCMAWPTPEEVLAIESVEDAFGQLGVIRSRSRTIGEIARLMVQGELCLGADALPDEQMQRLLAVKGVGPWTAHYIAMRTMGYPDAFLQTDAGVAHALPDFEPKERLQLAEAWRPWRSYAVISLWNSLVDS